MKYFYIKKYYKQQCKVIKYTKSVFGVITFFLKKKRRTIFSSFISKLSLLGILENLPQFIWRL